MLRINTDVSRFKIRLRKLREKGLEQYFSRESMTIPRPNGDTIRLPIDSIEIPQFTFGAGQLDRIGQGKGNVGDPLFDDGQEQGQGYGPGHGDEPGIHPFAELSIEEAADILRKQLELPNLLEKFEGKVGAKQENRYKGLRPIGPKPLRSFRRTYQLALKRAIASGEYNPHFPIVIPRREDERFKSPIENTKPATKAAIIYLLDYSGSMYSVIDFLQNVGWWCDAWIKKHYQHVAHRYIQYDSSAREVPVDEFYSVQAAGGTSINAGLQLTKKIAQKDFPESQYNLYLIHFTDGDCYGMEIAEEEIAWHQEMAKEFPDWYSTEKMPEVGNPLTDFLVPRCSAIFTCEAGAYYGDGGYTWGGRHLPGNYSNLLGNLVEARPSLDKKLRFVSFEDEEIKAARGEKIKETLIHWFK